MPNCDTFDAQLEPGMELGQPPNDRYQPSRWNVHTSMLTWSCCTWLTPQPSCSGPYVWSAPTLLLGSRLLDIHSAYNVAFALTEFQSQCQGSGRRVETIAHTVHLRLAAEDGDTDTAIEHLVRAWKSIRTIQRRGPYSARPTLLLVRPIKPSKPSGGVLRSRNAKEICRRRVRWASFSSASIGHDTSCRCLSAPIIG